MNQELKDQAHKEFDEKVKELKSAEFNSIGETAVFQFGYRLKDDNRSVWTITDWGGIKSFMDSIIDKTVQKTQDRIVGMIQTRCDLANTTAETVGEEIMYESCKEKIISLITNKSELSTNKDEK